MPTELDDETDPIAHAFAIQPKRRRSRRRGRQAGRAAGARRAWWSSTPMAMGAGEVTQTATEPVSSGGSVTEAETLTLAEFLDGM